VKDNELILFFFLILKTLASADDITTSNLPGYLKDTMSDEPTFVF
jgi:hypothetical protein